MAQDESGSYAINLMGGSGRACLAVLLGLMLGLSGQESAQAVTGGSPYDVQLVKNGSSAPKTVVTYIVAEATAVDIGDGNGPVTKAMTFKSCSDAGLTICTTPSIPGPEFRLTVGDQVTVHFVNNLPTSGLNPEANVSGIHWHGIELNNASDGTELTQAAVAPVGGTFDYMFTAKRPGIYWYHPHHHAATNQVVKGLYGSIIITDDTGYETLLIGNHVIPAADAAHTRTLVISDLTVCAAPGSNLATFDSALPHVSGIQSWQINYQNHPLTQSPLILCEADPMDANGHYISAVPAYNAGDIPNTQSRGLTGRMSEGFTVLTNGVIAGGRKGTPSAPGKLDGTAPTPLAVKAGQGLRLQIVNPSTVRYLRLRLTDAAGTKIPLVRIGGQGGLLDYALVEGGTAPSGFNAGYGRGEILLPPASRADVVAAIPSTEPQGSVLTMWTEDYQRVAATYSWTPTVPVMHLKVSGTEPVAYGMWNGRALLATLGPAARVPVLSASPDDLIDPATTGEDGYLGGPAGSVNKRINLTFFTNAGAFEASIDGTPMPRDFDGGLGGNPFYLESTRHASLSNTLELTVVNTTGAHHPFHLHGFSVQPISLTPRNGITGPSYTFRHEFQDVVNVPAEYKLKFRVSLDDRKMTDFLQNGGGIGRWLFHCHILPHATFGMMSELHVHGPN